MRTGGGATKHGFKGQGTLGNRSTRPSGQEKDAAWGVTPVLLCPKPTDEYARALAILALRSHGAYGG